MTSSLSDTMVQLDEADIDKLVEYFPDLDFSDAERRAVLLCNTSTDIQAAPGSGKTTLLAIKLALLASKWTESRRGICVLSHTNVARVEIEKRLSQIPGGSALLQYPHYVGTIQSFVHTFLALPLLRSRGVKVEFVDNDRFSRRAVALGRTRREISAWLSHPNMGRLKAIQTLRFEGAELALGSAEGTVPKTGTTRPVLVRLKDTLAREGLFRYDDMFAFAQHVLVKWPSTSAQLSYRFPLVFIDEMQDTDCSADQLLEEVFDKSVAVQRFGDINQAILSASELGTTTFPRNPYLSVSSSVRFGPELAKVTSMLKTVGPEIVGHGDAALAPVTFLVYTDATVTDVIPYFGEFVAETFGDGEIPKGGVKAIGARQKPLDNPRVGSSLNEYWPAYVHQDPAPKPMQQTISQLLATAYSPPSGPTQLTTRIYAAKTALVRLLRLTGCDGVDQVKSWRQLVDVWGEQHQGLISLRELALSCAVGCKLLDVNELRVVVHRFCEELKVWLPSSVTVGALLENEELQIELSAASERLKAGDSANIYRVVSHEKDFPINIGTIASVKGETHLATLVLESFNTRTFDVSAALPLLCGEKSIEDFKAGYERSHIKNLFVAASRPCGVLCLAVHKERLEAYEEKIKAQGWQVRQM